jgi:hypothetical protein
MFCESCWQNSWKQFRLWTKHNTLFTLHIALFWVLTWCSHVDGYRSSSEMSVTMYKTA